GRHYHDGIPISRINTKPSLMTDDRPKSKA
ncbi:MAG: hypothetical protein ACI9CE_000425, partial [Flavobacterium sp.]